MSSGSVAQAFERYQNNPNVDIIQVVGSGGNVLLALTANGGVQVAPQVISASGAVNPFLPGTYVITKNGVAALTLAAPIAGADDGNEIVITSTTANAHTLTATGLLQTGSSSVNTSTFANQPGAGLTLIAYQGKCYVMSQVGITFS